MAYQALYRTWRPMVFDDVAGQEHITKTLRNEIKTGNLAHAYLFCGTRGTGKTSTAKILARAVNCLNPVDGNPCNQCEICRGILDDSILDVVEMDGASKNKVENIREIIDDVAFLPSRARKKVYIIDEVHMVTNQAFNALLKTLEEPPSHVLFILATTELNKIPPTVLSRCQRFDFKRITADAICKNLQKIVDADNRKITPEALAMIAELGDGSMRDALSILEQVLGYSHEEITYDDLLSIVGITDEESLYSMCRAFAEGDGGKALTIFDSVIAGGKEPEVLIDSLTKFLRDILVVKLSQNPETILTASQSRLAKMKELATAFTREKLIFSLKTLNEAVASAKLSGYGRTVYELALAKLSEPAYDSSLEALLARMAELEKRLAGQVVIKKAEEPVSLEDAPPWEEEIKSPVPQPVPAFEPVQREERVQEEPPKEQTTEKTGTDPVSRFEEIKEFVRAHGGAPVLPHINRATPMMLKNKFTLVFPKDAMMNKTVVSRAGNIELLQIAIKAVIGQEIEVQCLSEKEAGIDTKNDAFDELLALGKKFDEFEII